MSNRLEQQDTADLRYIIIVLIGLIVLALFYKSSDEKNSLSPVRDTEASLPQEDYHVRMTQDPLYITDIHSGDTVYSESFDSKSKLTQAIINDNE